MTAFTDLLGDSVRLRRHGNWLVDLAILDAAGAPVAVPGEPSGALRAASRLEGFRTLPADTPVSALYRPDLAPLNGGGGGLELSASLWRGSGDEPIIGGGSLPNEAVVVLANRDGFYDTYRPSAGYLWDGRQATVRFGSGMGLPGRAGYMAYTDFRPFYFEIGEPTYSLSEVRVPLYGLDRRFDHPLSVLRHRGTAGCLDFAAGAYGACGTPAKMDLTGAMTWSGWINLDNTSANRTLMGWINGATLWPWNIVVLSGGGFSFNYKHSGGTGATHTMSALLTAGRWYHLAAAVTAAGALTLVSYDATTGAEVVEPFTTAAATRDANSGGTLQISRNSATTSMVGRVDEFRVWNVARTLSEIRSQRFGEIDVILSSLVGYYKFNETAGFSAADIGSGTTAPATLNGTIQWIKSHEGNSALAGQVKPDRWGRTEFLPGTLVDGPSQTWRVAGAGSVDAITPAEGLNAITSGGADITDEKTFSTTIPSGGTCRTYRAGGLVKLGSSYQLPLTFTVKGYKPGGTYADTKGKIIRDVVTTRGPDPLTDPGEIDTAAFSTAETLEPSGHGIAINGEMSIREFVDALAGPGWWWGFEFDSTKLTLQRWEGPAVTADLVVPAERIIAGPEPMGNLARIWQLQLGFAQIQEHGEEEINASIKTNSPSLYQRARMPEGWSLVTFEDADVLSDHPAARTHRFDTYYQWPDPAVSLTDPTGRDAAAAEAARLQAIFAQGYEFYRFTFDPIGLQLRLGETVAPIVRIGRSTYRMGFDGTRNLSVLSMSIDPESWNVTIVGLG